MKPSTASKRPRIFYGWVVVVSSSIMGGWVLSMGGANFGLFIGPMRDELGFSQSVFGWAITARFLGGALTGIFVGRLIDHFGPRVLLAMVATAAAALVASLGRISAEWQLLSIFACLGMLGMYGTAQGYTAPTAAKWFARRRPLAMTILYAGVPLVLIISVPLTQRLIDGFGWQTAWVILGLSALAIVVAPSLLLLRRQPQDMGLLPDGEPSAAANAASQTEAPYSDQIPMESTPEYSWTRAEALRSAAFWRLSGAFALQMFNQTSITLFRFPHFVERGVDANLVAFGLAIESVFALAAAATIGVLLNRIGMQKVAALGFILYAITNLILITGDSALIVFAMAVSFGFGISYLVMLGNIIYPAYFGSQHIGAIRGTALSISLIGTVIAGPITGYTADLTGSYVPVWSPMIGASLLAALLVVTTRPPQAPTRPVQQPPTAQPDS
jgi:MFS family permease